MKEPPRTSAGIFITIGMGFVVMNRYREAKFEKQGSRVSTTCEHSDWNRPTVSVVASAEVLAYQGPSRRVAQLRYCTILKTRSLSHVTPNTKRWSLMFRTLQQMIVPSSGLQLTEFETRSVRCCGVPTCRGPPATLATRQTWSPVFTDEILDPRPCTPS